MKDSRVRRDEPIHQPVEHRKDLLRRRWLTDRRQRRRSQIRRCRQVTGRSPAPRSAAAAAPGADPHPRMLPPGKLREINGHIAVDLDPDLRGHPAAAVHHQREGAVDVTRSPLHGRVVRLAPIVDGPGSMCATLSVRERGNALGDLEPHGNGALIASKIGSSRSGTCFGFAVLHPLHCRRCNPDARLEIVSPLWIRVIHTVNPASALVQRR